MPELRLSTANVTLNSEEKRNYLDVIEAKETIINARMLFKIWEGQKSNDIAFSELTIKVRH